MTNSIRLFNRRAGYVAAAIAMVLAAVVPALVSAATVTERSIELSTSAKGATGVSYKVTFTAATANTGAYALVFCDSPTINTTCNAPADLSVTTPTTTGGDTVSAIGTNGVKVVLASAAAAGDTVTTELAGLTNPSAVGAFYARIVTYQDGSTNYHYTDATTLGSHLDEGSVALSATNSVGVTGTVNETLTFCAAGGASAIADNCDPGNTLPLPNLTLGTNGILGTTLSEGTIHSLISTNAVGGAVVSLKSSATGCGGLIRSGTGTNTERCGIKPVTSATTTIADNASQFGLKLANIDNGTGTVSPVADYGTTNYFMRYATGDGSGVTSTYGDPIYNTNGAPISNGKVDLTFGANISDDTPAGTYSATLNLIATGKF